MMRMILLVLWMGLSLATWAQTQPNPFDLKYRPQRPITELAKPSSDTFYHIAEPQLTPEAQAPLVNPISKDSIEIVTDTSRLSSNPFEVRNGSGDTAKASQEVKSHERPQPGATLVTKHLSKGIQIFFILLSLLFLIFIVNVERNFVRDLWRVISNENYSSLHQRNQRNTMRRILLMMGYLIFIFQAGIFLFHVMRVFGYQGKLLASVWACIAFVFVVYLVRHLIIRYLRWLFNNDKEMTLFGFDISIFNIMVGLMLLPVNVLLNFGPENLVKPLIIIGIIVLIAAYLLRQLRWMLTARQMIANSLFLFFVYLCAVEILPLWAISTILR